MLPANTMKANLWAFNNFQAWVAARKESHPSDPVPDNLLSSSDAETLCRFLCLYVMETRQEDGTCYPPIMIYSLLCGLYRITRSNDVPLNFIDKNNSDFRSLHQTLDYHFSELHSEGVGADRKSGSVISFEDEEILWAKKLLSYDNPKSLLQRMLFYCVGLNFCLRGGQEHHGLKAEQFTRFPSNADYNEQTCYEYREFI